MRKEEFDEAQLNIAVQTHELKKAAEEKDQLFREKYNMANEK